MIDTVKAYKGLEELRQQNQELTNSLLHCVRRNTELSQNISLASEGLQEALKSIGTNVDKQAVSLTSPQPQGYNVFYRKGFDSYAVHHDGLLVHISDTMKEALEFALKMEELSKDD